MANISRDTFDAMKHYVSVRLQQGVPLVDADWNEKDDIRRHELRCFLKWFVGDGVPTGNNGFRIITDALVLRFSKGPCIIKIDESDVANGLGFGIGNNSIVVPDLSATQDEARIFAGVDYDLSEISNNAAFSIRIDDLPKENVILSDTSTLLAIANCIHNHFSTKEKEILGISCEVLQSCKVINSSGEEQRDDFIIKGGDGTPLGAGRCLIDGMEVVNEVDRYYSEQFYFEEVISDPKRKSYKKRNLPALNISTTNKTELIYLDVWEREVFGLVSSEEGGDPSIVNDDIRDQTCTRIKRDWVVRVSNEIKYDENHFYYAVAGILWNSSTDYKCEDLRSSIKVPSPLEINQIIADSFGDSYIINRYGQPQLKLSLKERIDAILNGEIPNVVTNRTPGDSKHIVVTKNGDKFCFYEKNIFRRMFHCSKFDYNCNAWHIFNNALDIDERYTISAVFETTANIFWIMVQCEEDQRIMLKLYRFDYNNWKITNTIEWKFDQEYKISSFYIDITKTKLFFFYYNNQNIQCSTYKFKEMIDMSDFILNHSNYNWNKKIFPIETINYLFVVFCNIVHNGRGETLQYFYKSKCLLPVASYGWNQEIRLEIEQIDSVAYTNNKIYIATKLNPSTIRISLYTANDRFITKEKEIGEIIQQNFSFHKNQKIFLLPYVNDKLWVFWAEDDEDLYGICYDGINECFGAQVRFPIRTGSYSSCIEYINKHPDNEKIVICYSQGDFQYLKTFHLCI
jgi:hypothetical protein